MRPSDAFPRLCTAVAAGLGTLVVVGLFPTAEARPPLPKPAYIVYCRGALNQAGRDAGSESDRGYLKYLKVAEFCERSSTGASICLASTGLTNDGYYKDHRGKKTRFKLEWGTMRVSFYVLLWPSGSNVCEEGAHVRMVGEDGWPSIKIPVTVNSGQVQYGEKSVSRSTVRPRDLEGLESWGGIAVVATADDVSRVQTRIEESKVGLLEDLAEVKRDLLAAVRTLRTTVASKDDQDSLRTSVVTLKEQLTALEQAVNSLDARLSALEASSQ
jgi:hypothetical protein